MRNSFTCRMHIRSKQMWKVSMIFTTRITMFNLIVFCSFMHSSSQLCRFEPVCGSLAPRARSSFWGTLSLGAEYAVYAVVGSKVFHIPRTQISTTSTISALLCYLYFCACLADDTVERPFRVIFSVKHDDKTVIIECKRK